MNKFVLHITPTPYLLALLLYLSSSTIAQQAGKIISSEEANNNFGAVGQVTLLSKSFLETMLKQAGQSIMFRVTDSGLIILDANRNVLFPESKETKIKVNKEDVFTVYSSSVVYDLLNRGEGTSVNIEQRAEVLSITFGLSTLEFGNYCPPFCN
jgi:signal recognition particle receptor subunit beta